MNRVSRIGIIGILSFVLIADCWAGGGQEKQQSGPQEVSFWYFWKGDEGSVIEKIIADYNKSQSKYVVKGLSVPDNQKIITAISGGEGPDVIAGLSGDVPGYASQEIVAPLESYISRDKVDITRLNKNAVMANQFQGKTYGIPNSTTIIAMFYNKDLLKAAGYTNPPKTMEELYDMALKLTKTDQNGDITQIGFPVFPLKAYPQEGAYAFGARYVSADGKTLTPDNQGTIKALDLNFKFRQQFGLDKMSKYVATSNTARYTPQDQFFAGNQAIRFDGLWLCDMIAENSPNLSYGIAPIPGTKDHPENLGSSRLETDALMIPVTAKAKDGAWDFIKYFTFGPGAKTYVLNKGDIPALTELAKDSDVTAVKGMKEFMAILNLNKSIPFPIFPDASKYLSLIIDYADFVYNGKKTGQEAMKELKGVVDSTLTLK